MVVPILRLSLALALALFWSGPAGAEKFYPDDPLRKNLPPLNTPDANARSLSPILEYLGNTFSRSGERHPSSGVIPALGTNTLGEVPDGTWYVNRHARKRLTRAELIRGPGDSFPPRRDRPWDVLTVKPRGFRPGILIEDSAERQYLLRFDPPRHLEMSTAAEIISSKFLHALGYWTTENYLVYFDRGQLRAAPEGADIDSMGQPRNLIEEDIDDFLRALPSDPARGYRAVATRVPDGFPLGPFQFYGTRGDDPNDLFPHEHRRDLRGLYVFSAWLNNIRAEATSTLDVVVSEEIDGENIRFIRHFLIDFFASLGSGEGRRKEAREGNDLPFAWDSSIRNFADFGIHTPKWMKSTFRKLPSVGRFEYANFDPERWNPNYVSAPFANRLPDDEFWAAKILMTLTDDDIRAVVSTGEYSDPAAEEWVAKCLIERRDKIGRAYFSKLLPLDNFRVQGDELQFENLAAQHGFPTQGPFQVHWSTFDNVREQRSAIDGADNFELPGRMKSSKAGEYFLAAITPRDLDLALVNPRVEVYVRRSGSGFEVAGIDRTWSGKVVAKSTRKAPGKTRNRYAELTDRQRKLFDTYADAYKKETALDLTAQEYWSSLSISERTTYDAVTDALEKTQLTTETGEALGLALDLGATVDRIAGQYYGRGGDEQFRVYFKLRPDAREILERSQEFYRDKDNTVYHVGYPYSYRQTGKPPTMQFSMSEDGLNGDVDVDYRSSKMPKAMWNGHITSANSDVRAGNNHKRHVARWAGLGAWWQGLFGEFPTGQTTLLDLFVRKRPADHVELPANRPLGSNPENLYDATQEFLTDWLQRGNYGEAMEFFSDQSLRCMGQSREEEIVVNSLAEAQRTLRRLLKEVNDELGRIENLTEAIEGVEPWRRDRFAPMEQPYRPVFSAFGMRDDDAKQFLCQDHPALEEAARAAAPERKTAPTMPQCFAFFSVKVLAALSACSGPKKITAGRSFPMSWSGSRIVTSSGTVCGGWRNDAPIGATNNCFRVSCVGSSRFALSLRSRTDDGREDTSVTQPTKLQHAGSDLHRSAQTPLKDD